MTCEGRLSREISYKKNNVNGGRGRNEEGWGDELGCVSITRLVRGDMTRG